MVGSCLFKQGAQHYHYTCMISVGRKRKSDFKLMPLLACKIISDEVGSDK